MSITHIILLKLLKGVSALAVAARVGPLISQAVFRMEKTTGTFAIGETLGLFRKPKSDGIFKP